MGHSHKRSDLKGKSFRNEKILYKCYGQKLFTWLVQKCRGYSNVLASIFYFINRLPVLIIDVASGNKLTPGNTFATIGLLNFMSVVTIFLMSLAMSGLAEYFAFMRRLG